MLVFICECSIALRVESCDLWCFGCSMGTILFGGAICYKVFCLVVSIDIGRLYMIL